MIKVDVILESIMDVWNIIINSSMKELYVKFVIHFRKACVKYPEFLKYIKSIILELVKENIVCAWTQEFLIRSETLEIQQLINLTLLMLHWRIYWKIIKAIYVEVETPWIKWSKINITRYKHNLVAELQYLNIDSETTIFIHSW